MKLGLIGLPQSGKTTVFNALTRGSRPTTSGGGRFEVHTAVVDVPDPRVDQLSALFQPKKTTYAQVMYADIAGLEGRAAARQGISGPLLNELKQMDAFLLVLRAFENDSVPHPDGQVDPQRDLETMLGEFLIHDLISIERRLERLQEERRKGGGRDRALIDRESALFARIQEVLNSENSMRTMSLSPEEERMISGYQFLSRKPLLVVVNGDESGTPAEVTPPDDLPVMHFMGKLEMEIAQLPEDEAQVFMEEFGLKETGLERMIRRSFNLLNLLTFFTVGEEEVRAWTLRRGSTAPEAAGVIHTDLQKGFIRAEVIAWDELLELGGLNEAKKKGRLRIEGRDYVVQEGEIVHIRFNI